MKLRLLLLFLFAAPVWAHASFDGWNITTSEREDYNGAVVGNGRFGIGSSPSLLKSQFIVLAGVYDLANEFDVSQIMNGPVFTDLEMVIDGAPVKDDDLEGWSQNLDMKRAVFSASATVPGKAVITRELRALRHLPNVAVVNVEVKPLADITLKVINRYGLSWEMNTYQSTFKEGNLMVYQYGGLTRTGKERVSAASMFKFEGKEPQIVPAENPRDGISFTVTLKKGIDYRFALTGAIASTADCHDPVNESKRMAVYVYKSNLQEHIARHEKEWAELWKSDIIIEGDPAAQQFVRHGLYQMYSVIREGQALSLSPRGLTSRYGGYNGHYFWDTELWMYPVYLALQPGMARSLMDYRCNAVGPAKENAAMHGYKGAMYPWEADPSGYECTPVWALTGTYEHHITADIGIAMWNYYCVTRDKAWLKEKAWPVLREIATFWTDRVTKNADGSYSILNVVAADEYAENVDDNAFTNAAAACVLRNITDAAKVVGEKPDPVWNEIADKLVFIKDKDGVIAEYRGYDGRRIKQADVNLLAHPLGVQKDHREMKVNAEYYEPRMAPNGPAMSQSVLVVIHARLGDPDRALQIFRGVCDRHLRGPFGTFSETANTNSVSFLTGVGGMLQSILFGFGGLEITPKGLVQKDPILPAEWKSLTITGVGPERKTYATTRHAN